MPTAFAYAGPYGTYPPLPPPPAHTLSTVPLHPSVPEDAQRSGFFVSPSGRLFLPGGIKVTPTLNGSGYVTQCTLSVTFYEVDSDSGQLVRALTDTPVLNAPEGGGVLIEQSGQPPCAAGLGAGAVDEAGAWLYYPVVASLSGPTRYDLSGGVESRSFQAVLLVRQIGLAGTGGSGSTVLQQDYTDPSSPLSNVGLPPRVALSGPADASSASPRYLLLTPRINNQAGFQIYSGTTGSVLALDLSGSGIVRARPVGLGLPAATWVIDQSTGGSGTSTYDMYLLYIEVHYDFEFCTPLLARGMPFGPQMRPADGYNPCFTSWLVRDKGAASADAIARWPVVTWTSDWPWTATQAAAPPGVDVEVIPFTLATPSLPEPAVQLAAGGSKVFLSDPYRCQILELDPATGAAKVAAGYDSGSAGAVGTRPVCSIFPTDGPATGGRPMAAPGRMAADALGALVFFDETTKRLHRLSPA